MAADDPGNILKRTAAQGLAHTHSTLGVALFVLTRSEVDARILDSAAVDWAEARKSIQDAQQKIEQLIGKFHV